MDQGVESICESEEEEEELEKVRVEVVKVVLELKLLIGPKGKGGGRRSFRQLETAVYDVRARPRTESFRESAKDELSIVTSIGEGSSTLKRSV
jgi:hypothetical protein